MRQRCYVYIMANPLSRVLYVGMTCQLPSRISSHKSREIEGFTAKYNVTDLVYYEEHDGPRAAIEREKQIKKYRRQKKISLIEGVNPVWRDLSRDIV
jgi:putative endonuclease